jgi:hypothetical protein
MNDDDNNVAELAFGAEFDFDAPSLKEDLKCLTNDQVYFLLDKQLRRQVQFGSATTETFDQTYTFIEKVATTRRVDDIGTLVSELSVQLRELELEKKGASGKMDKLHQFEVAMLANLIKAVRLFRVNTGASSGGWWTWEFGAGSERSTDWTYARAGRFCSLHAPKHTHTQHVSFPALCHRAVSLSPFAM